MDKYLLFKSLLVALLIIVFNKLFLLRSLSNKREFSFYYAKVHFIDAKKYAKKHVKIAGCIVSI